MSFNHNQVIGAQNAGNELGDHALQMQVLCQDIDALRELTKPHIGNIARDGRLCAIKAHGAELIHQYALRTHVFIAHNISDGILAPIAFFSHTNPHSKRWRRQSISD